MSLKSMYTVNCKLLVCLLAPILVCESIMGDEKPQMMSQQGGGQWGAVENQLRTRIEANKAIYDPEEPMIITFHVQNVGSQKRRILIWQSPLEEDFTADYFEVTHGQGHAVTYIGKLVKRGEPLADDFIWIKPGEVITKRIDLKEGYAITNPGEYVVRYKRNLVNKLPASNDVKLHRRGH